MAAGTCRDPDTVEFLSPSGVPSRPHILSLISGDVECTESSAATDCISLIVLNSAFHQDQNVSLDVAVKSRPASAIILITSI